jgi:dTDP-4-dehydrorhamnose reductase
MKKVLVLGANGMLGHACVNVLKSSKNIEVAGTTRGRDSEFIDFDASNDSIVDLLAHTKPDWIINCIGIIKPHIKESDPLSVLNAIRINSEFPHALASSTKSRIIQIATDCVFSGTKGLYVETDLHDATDVYGKTKSLGEVTFENVHHLRVSIIGPEIGRSTSLLEWFRNQPISASINGYSDHLWNGVTTHQFGKLAYGLIANDYFEVAKTHVVPADVISKAGLLREFAVAYAREDIAINETDSATRIDRTLSTINPETNRTIWKMAGYETIPTVSEMVLEQAAALTEH